MDLPLLKQSTAAGEPLPASRHSFTIASKLETIPAGVDSLIAGG